MAIKNCKVCGVRFEAFTAAKYCCDAHRKDDIRAKALVAYYKNQEENQRRARESMQKKREGNREAARQYNREWLEKNRAKMREWRRTNRLKNLEHHRERARGYYDKRRAILKALKETVL